MTQERLDPIFSNEDDDVGGRTGFTQALYNEECSCMDPRSPEDGCQVHRPGTTAPKSGKIGRLYPTCTCGMERMEPSPPHTQQCLVMVSIRLAGVTPTRNGTWRQKEPKLVKLEQEWIRKNYGADMVDAATAEEDPGTEEINSPSVELEPPLQFPGRLMDANLERNARAFIMWAGIDLVFLDRFIHRVSQFQKASKDLKEL